jgi:hypothetical protein
MYILDVTILYDYIVRFGEKIKILFLNQFLRPKKIICVLPIDPKILPPTLTFFMPKKNNRSAKSGNSSPFQCLFPTSTIDA